MPHSAFTEDLATFGPERCAAAPLSLEASREYCRRLAESHYENFHVASALLPRALRPHFHAVYAYCRWSDDLADEVGDRVRSLELLDWWENELEACFAGEARHPVFQALRETITAFAIPQEPFANLLVAFRQDQQQARYETFADLQGYCQNSANPVGRLVLYLGEVPDAERFALSDQVCTGLQLANFCQDVANDWERGRVYLPQQTLRDCGYGEREFAAATFNAAFQHAMATEVDRAEKCLRAGLPLVDMMPRGLRGDVWLFAQGGLAILDRIRRQNYDVWSNRPKISKSRKLRLLAGALWRNAVGASAANRSPVRPA